MAACGLCLVLLQFDGVPVYLVRTLRQRSVRDDAAVADEDDGTYDRYLVPVIFFLSNSLIIDVLKNVYLFCISLALH